MKSNNTLESEYKLDKATAAHHIKRISFPQANFRSYMNYHNYHIKKVNSRVEDGGIGSPHDTISKD